MIICGHLLKKYKIQIRFKSQIYILIYCNMNFYKNILLKLKKEKYNTINIK